MNLGAAYMRQKADEANQIIFNLNDTKRVNFLKHLQAVVFKAAENGKYKTTIKIDTCSNLFYLIDNEQTWLIQVMKDKGYTCSIDSNEDGTSDIHIIWLQ